jgi:hypothetical protein
VTEDRGSYAGSSRGKRRSICTDQPARQKSGNSDDELQDIDEHLL